MSLNLIHPIFKGNKSNFSFNYKHLMMMKKISYNNWNQILQISNLINILIRIKNKKSSILPVRLRILTRQSKSLMKSFNQNKTSHRTCKVCNNACKCKFLFQRIKNFKNQNFPYNSEGKIYKVELQTAANQN